MTEQVIDLIKKQCKDIYISFESNLFKLTYTEPQLYSLLQIEHIKNILLEYCVQYFNDTYIQNINKTNIGHNDIYHEIHSLNNHSYLCILHQCFNIISSLISSSNRILFDYSSYDTYFASVTTYTQDQIKQIDFTNLFNHNCNEIIQHTSDTKFFIGYKSH